MNTLHKTIEATAMLPRYVTRFQCTGPACEDNCCTGWRVALDKQTFNAYRQSRHAGLSERFANEIRRQRSQASDSNYAHIELVKSSQECPFLEQRLCAIQRELGESHLSNTCFVYPRSSRRLNGQYEQALMLSCPEAAKLALLDADAFDFVADTIRLRAETAEEIKPRHGMSLQSLDEVRIFCLQLMRTDGLELWQRLAVLGVFCESLTTLLTQARQAEIAELIASFATMIGDGSVLDALADLPPNHEVQARLFAIFWGSKKYRSVSPIQQQVVDAVASGLGADPANGQVTIERLVERYSAGIARLPAALQAAPHLLDHYLLNEMFRELFPFGRNNPYEHYLQLVSRFGLLRLMLAAQCNAEQLPDATALVRTVQVLSRRFQHDQNFAGMVSSALRSSGWNQLDKVYGFLRS